MTLGGSQPSRPPFYRDATVVKWFAQIVTLAVVLGVMWFLAKEAGDNLAAKDIATDFDFINDDPGFGISEGIDTDPSTGGRALWVGMVNTIRMAAAGIVMATILGIIIGIARLSNNWMVNRAAGIYIEALRNVPVLVQILLYAAILGSAGRLFQDSGPIEGWVIRSAKGVSLPRVFIADGFYQWAVWLLIGAAVGWVLRRNQNAKRDATGQVTYPNIAFLCSVAVFAIIGWFAHPVFGFFTSIFEALGDAYGAIPVGLLQILLASGSVALAVLWIKRFLDDRRTPAGLAKLTDDDYFRMIFAGLGGLLAALLFLRIWPGLSSWILNSGQDLLYLLSDKFGNGRTGQPIDAMKPTTVGQGTLWSYGPQGLTLSVGFAAVFLGVTLYTAAFIAEIVRGGINAVPKGQGEAAAAIGLSRIQALRQVILPQAFRVSLPPIGNQYLNLTKNTSLGIAVGYADVVNTGSTVLNQSGRPLSIIAIWMLFYLACSLTISVVVNWFNVRMKIVER